MGVTIDMCALCGAKDFRRCGCPWAKTFDCWPYAALEAVKQMIGPGPYKGS